MGEITPSSGLKSSAFNFNIAQMLTSSDHGSAGLSECKAAWNNKFPSRTLDDCIKPTVHLPVIRADDHCSSYVHETDGKGLDDGSK
jgi:hypothetical protein